ncbi:MAG: HAD family hydrolase [Oscillospiraceae bacterium]|nr:HAD family hydrolase [Oscillospiraceae bacterium]
MNQKQTVYFFDLYGTLVDIRTDETKSSLWRGAAEFYSLCGAAYRSAELRERYLALCAEESSSLAAARPELGEEGVEIELRNVFRRLFEEKSAPVSDERAADAALLFRALSYRRSPRLMRGARETLAELRRRGARIFLLSNAQNCFTMPELRKLGLDEAFDTIFLSSDFGCKKPSPVFFAAALASAGVSPEEALMVGNDPDADMRGAASVGMPGCYIHTWQSPPRRSPLPEGCVEIAELTDLLK